MRAITKMAEFEVVLQLQRKTNKPICASILRKRSYFNTQKMLRKQINCLKAFNKQTKYTRLQ